MRYFVQFRPNTSLKDKLMVFSGMTEQQVRNEMNREYPDAVMRIFTEPEVAQILPNVYGCKEQWVHFGNLCEVTKIDCNGKSIGKRMLPVSTNTEPYEEHAVSLKSITDWFNTAKPNPVEKDLPTQLGAYVEEVCETISALKGYTNDSDLTSTLFQAELILTELKDKLYTIEKLDKPTDETKVALLDGLADVAVTITGSAYFAGFQWDKALTEVNQSNFSKFEGGKAIKNDDGKIMKGKNYRKPNLEPFINKA